jgi:hypothetical protein
MTCLSTEAEYISVADIAGEINWVYSLLSKLHFLVSHTPVIYCDNIGSTQLSLNHVFTQEWNTLLLIFTSFDKGFNLVLYERLMCLQKIS